MKPLRKGSRGWSPGENHARVVLQSTVEVQVVEKRLRTSEEHRVEKGSAKITLFYALCFGSCCHCSCCLPCSSPAVFLQTVWLGKKEKAPLEKWPFPLHVFWSQTVQWREIVLFWGHFFFFFFSLPVFVAAPESCHALASLILIPWQFICQSLPLDLQYDCFHPSLLFCPSIIDYKSPGNVELCFFFLKQNLKEFIVLYYLRMYFCHFCFFLLLCEWPHNRNKNLTDEEKWNNQASNCHQIM